jgi:proteic killer suppression protein
VQVEFRTARLERCYVQFRAAVREWGDKAARRYIERINVLKSSKSADDLYKVPSLAFHPLKGDEKGRYALTVIDRMRMVVSFRDRVKTIVRVEEVTQHYGD